MHCLDFGGAGSQHMGSMLHLSFLVTQRSEGTTHLQLRNGLRKPSLSLINAYFYLEILPR